MIGVFWLTHPITHPDTFEVLIDGKVRTDYEKIVRVGDGAQGVLFDDLSHDEMCSVSIRRVVRPRSMTHPTSNDTAPSADAPRKL